ncbi:MAG: hypothetical protein M1812_004832 [Candelaria pacifica]|nr:MAG: hypothetical protein M1812_004832 [Candelaria pacifica]
MSADEGHGDALAASTALREKGNEFYKQNQILEALDVYKEASAIDPNNPALLSNISAAYFEVGDYTQCVAATEAALNVVGNDVDALTAKLNHRLIKSYIHLQQLDLAHVALKKTKVEDEELQVYKTTLNHMNAVFAASPDKDCARARIINELPRYRPTINAVDEYFSIGHDTISTEDGDDIPPSSSAESQSSFFFGGVGDARHLYATMIRILAREQACPDLPEKKYHFTINDTKAPAIARDILVLLLLHDLSELEDSASDEGTLILNTLFYLFIAPIMPGYVFDHLQKTISRAIESLNSSNTLPPWIYINQGHKTSLCDALTPWQEEVSRKWDTSRMIELTLQSNLQTRQSLARMMPGRETEGPAPKGCDHERKAFRQAAVLYPPATMEHRDAPLQKLLLKSNIKPHTNKIKAYLTKAWRTNVTLIDVEWEESKNVDWEKSKSRDRDLKVESEQFSLAERLYSESNLTKPTDPTRLYDYVAPFFMKVAEAIKRLKGRMVIEAVCGEFADVMEDIRYGILDHRSTGASTEDGSLKFPHLYDRIYMSNIPDYVGGHLTSFLYAIPVTKSTPTSYITSNCLRNPPLWDTVDDFNNECLLINDEDTLLKLTQVKLVPGQELELASPLPLASYISWQRLSTAPHPFSSLLPRADLNKWLYGLFFKLALPVHRRSLDMALVNAPLNLTAYFRVLIHLHELGYPAHWLSTVLTNILENTVATTARPPQTVPLDIAEVRQRNPAKKQTTAPYIPEMATLAVLFERFLPFSLITPVLPSLDSIHHYTMETQEVSYTDSSAKSNVLIFYDHRRLTDVCAGPPMNLRLLFDPTDCELDENAPKVRKLRETGLIMMTTFEFDRETDTASFWMKRGFVDMMMAQKGDWWKCGIWRTDAWRPVVMPLSVKTAVRRGRKWVP